MKDERSAGGLVMFGVANIRFPAVLSCGLIEMVELLMLMRSSTNDYIKFLDCAICRARITIEDSP